MKGLLFLALWIGCATLHTIFDLKIRPIIQERKNDWREPTL